MLKRYIEEGGLMFDLVIVGGGTYRVAVAYTLRAAFSCSSGRKRLWRRHLGSATSKLIHGGLRYSRRTGELKLVREPLRERRILGNIAPNFVYPLPFLLPMYAVARQYLEDVIEQGL